MNKPVLRTRVNGNRRSLSRRHSLALVVRHPGNRFAGKPESAWLRDEARPCELRQHCQARRIVDLLQVAAYPLRQRHVSARDQLQALRRGRREQQRAPREAFAGFCRHASAIAPACTWVTLALTRTQLRIGGRAAAEGGGGCSAGQGCRADSRPPRSSPWPGQPTVGSRGRILAHSPGQTSGRVPRAKFRG